MKSLNFQYLSRLDHLRFFASILVVFHHFRGYVADAIPNGFPSNSFISWFTQLWMLKGSSGVSLFLVLSAFLFTLITHAGEKKIIYHKFIYNRILRIFPLMVFLVFIVITLDRANSSPLDILRIFTLQLNTGNPMTGWGHSVFPSGPIWTIAVEFQFYFLFPILMIFLSRYGAKYLLLLMLFLWFSRLIIVSLNGYDVFYNLYHSIIGRLDQFLIGIFIAVLYVRDYFKKLSNSMNVVILFLSIFLLSFYFVIEDKLHNAILKSVFSFPIEAILWGGVIVAYLNIKFPFSIFNWLDKMLSYLGGLSFSIYLFHLPVGYFISNALNLGEPTSIYQSIVYSLIRLPFIILFSVISYHAIEKPFMELRTKYFKNTN
jgi:acyltransferase 3